MGYVNGQSGAFIEDSTALGAGASLGLSEASWKIRVLQAWLHGFLERTASIGRGHGRMTEIVFNCYSMTEAGKDFLSTEPLPSVLLPTVKCRSMCIRVVAMIIIMVIN